MGMSLCFLPLICFLLYKICSFLPVCHCVSAAPPSSRVCQVAHVRN